MQLEPPTRWPFAIAELRPALDLIAALTRASQAVLLLTDDAAGALRPAAGLGLDATQWALVLRHNGRHDPPGADDGALDDPIARAIAERQRIVIENAHESATALTALATLLGARTVEILPLLDGEGPVVGAMLVLSRRAHGTRRHLRPLVDECLQLVVRMMHHARRRESAERARAEAEQSARARAQFFARMSHELRTPLQSIAGYLDLLRLGAAEPLTSAQRRLLERVQHNEELLVHVIDDLILFARLGTGRVQFSMGVAAADEAVQIAHAVVAPLADARGVRLSVEPSRGLAALADGDKLKQILVSVAAHAIKSCAPHGAVQIGCRADEPWVVFEIRHDGPGYSAAQLRVLFEPYVIPDEPLIDRGETGMGLAISRELAAGMHGQLTAANLVPLGRGGRAPGSGAVFTLRLPRTATSRS